MNGCRLPGSYHQLVEELQPCSRLPPAPVEAADFERTLPDQQNNTPSQEAQQGEGHIDEQLEEEGGERQASPCQLKHYRRHHAQAECRDEPERGAERRRGEGGRHGPLFPFSSSGAATPSSQWCNGS